MIKKYLEVTSNMKNMNINKKDKTKAFLLSLLLSLLIMMGPLILVVNLFLFITYFKLLVFLLGIIIFLIIFLREFFYLNFLYDKIKNKVICYIFNLAIPFIIIFGVVIYFLIKGVI